MKTLVKPIIFDFEEDFYSEGPDTVYKHIPGFNGYMVGNKGDVVSYKHYKANGDHGHHIKQRGIGDNRYVIIQDEMHKPVRIKVKRLVMKAFVDDKLSHAQPTQGTYYAAGVHKLKSIPKTEEERAELGYGIYDNIRKAITGNATQIDMEGNVIYKEGY